MQLFFKTLDHKTFNMEVDMDGAVENIISKLEDDLGQDNLYKLIYAGKLLKEEKPLSDYNISNKIPIIVMVTKIRDSAGGVSKSLKTEQTIKSGEYANLKRTRTVTEDSGFGEDFDTDHFDTNAEFDNVVETIQNYEYLGRKEEPAIAATISDIKTILISLCEEEIIENMKLAAAILDNSDDVIDAQPNKQQLNDLLKDVQSIFEESRGTLRDLEGILGWLDDISSDEKDHVADTKMRRRFKEMAFSKESIDNALRQNLNNIQGSAEICVPTIDLPA